jgi:hypothetical protein
VPAGFYRSGAKGVGFNWSWALSGGSMFVEPRRWLMKSVLVASLLLIATSAQASFLCTSKEVREDGQPAYGMHVHEARENTSTHIAIWKTGKYSAPYQFDCVRESTEYDGGRTSDYKCAASGDKTLQVYSQLTGVKIQATADLRSASEGQLILSSMNCKPVED